MQDETAEVVKRIKEILEIRLPLPSYYDVCDDFRKLYEYEKKIEMIERFLLTLE